MDLLGKGKMRLLIAVLVALAALVGGGAYYFGYYVKTPEYAVRMMGEAVAAHDQAKLERYADVARIVETSSDAFLEGMMDADRVLSEEARIAVSSFAQMFRMSVSMSFQDAIREAVRAGGWSGASGSGPADVRLILDRAGLSQMEPRGFEGIERTAEGGTEALFRVFQREANEEFVFRARMEKAEDGAWRATEIVNFREFIALIAEARREQLRGYLRTTAEALRAHDDAIGAADKKLVDILHSGNIGDADVRRQMRDVMMEDILSDWQARRKELEAIEPPAAAQPLHRLRLHICDMRIAYALRYAEWLETKSAGDIQEANELLKEARTLEEEADAMVRQMERRNA